LSYRDSWRLFLRFVAAQKTKSVSKLGMDDLTAIEVLAFLKDVEQVRKSSIGTRNCRLAALHSFFKFVADREPLAAAQCAAVLGIPTKKAPVTEVRDLDEDEISAILAQPDRSKLEGQRDHVLLAVLYNTGARIQEALDLFPQAIRWESPFQVRLFGKGRKERICPLWPETVELLKALLKRKPRREDEPIFVNRYGNPLQASGVRFKLKQYAAAAGKRAPSLLSKRVSPHRFRHNTETSITLSHGRSIEIPQQLRTEGRQCHQDNRPVPNGWCRSQMMCDDTVLAGIPKECVNVKPTPTARGSRSMPGARTDNLERWSV